MDSEVEKILNECISPDVDMKYLNYKSLFVPDTYRLIADSIENFEVRDDDVWVCSFPKAGTTWTQEMVWNIANDLNFEAAKVSVDERFPFLEFIGTTTTGYVTLTKLYTEIQDREVILELKGSIGYVKNMASPRFIKTHLPFHLLPRQLRTNEKKNKIIYVARNPKDVCISYYHHYKLLEAYQSSFENFCKLFLADKVYYAPFWKHVIGYWEKKNDSNVLFLKYEDMKTDLPSVIRKTANFLGKMLNDEHVKILKEHLSFESMKKNPAVNRDKAVETLNENKLFGQSFQVEGSFMRKGKAGDWKTTMSQEWIAQFDSWTEKQLMDYKNLKDEFSQKPEIY